MATLTRSKYRQEHLTYGSSKATFAFYQHSTPNLHAQYSRVAFSWINWPDPSATQKYATPY